MAGKCTRDTACHGHFGPTYVCTSRPYQCNDYTETSCKSYWVVTDAVADRLVPSRLAAFLSIVTQLQAYLTAFQSDNLLMPFVCGKLSSIVPVRIMKPYILD